MGSNDTNTTWRPYAKIAFQDDLSTGDNGAAYAGDCQSKVVPDDGLIYGLTCDEVSEATFGFCALDGSAGSWYTNYGMPYNETETCLSRYVHIQKPYPV